MTSSSPRLKIALIGECMLELSGQAFGTLRQSYGGDTFNTATYLTRCAGDRIEVSYATAVGDDPLSDELLRRWRDDGIDTGLVRKIAGKMPGMYLIETDEHGERRFSFWRDSSAARVFFDVEETPLEQRAAEWDAFYFSGISLAILPPEGRARLFAFAAKLRERGARVIFDNNYRPRLWQSADVARASFDQAFACADLSLVTLDDHQALYGFAQLADAQAHAFALASPELVIKRGRAPTMVRAPEFSGIAEIPTTAVEKVVDTTAAGDSFAAAYLARRLLGAGPVDAAAFGNQLAGRVIQHPGAIIPRAAMEDLMA